MSILDKVAKIEKRIEKLATRKDVVRQPVEIRRAILDEIEEHAEPAGRSRRVLPYNRLTIQVRSKTAAERAAFEAVLEPGRLKQAISDHLRDAGCESGPGLEVSLRFVRKAPAGWEDSQLFKIAYERGPVRSQAPGASQPGTARISAQIVVLKGQATRKSYPVAGERTNIGRLAEVTDKDHRAVRRNHVVFADSDDEANRTVSRAQAHIQFVPPAEYRLHDDRSSHGTRIFRQGRTIEIPSGSPRGVKLRARDEIYFGQACVRFEIRGRGDRSPGP
jgi:hypothetical protein